MSEIKITKVSENNYGWECNVLVMDDDSETEHIVTVPLPTYVRLTGKQYPVEELVKKSFDFLLTKESKESILGIFTLDEIGNYFPEWEREMVK
ncbi:MAG: hypothetical protein Q8P20_09275 [bacterium]|nr:hypothetical protein [bacterium]